MPLPAHERFLRKRRSARAAAANLLATAVITVTLCVAVLGTAVYYTWPLLERAALGPAVSHGSGDPNKLWPVQEYVKIPKVLQLTAAPPPRYMTMFRGNPARTLTGTGKVPRRPKLLWRFQTHTKLEGPYELRGSDKVDPGTPWSGLGWTGQPLYFEGRYYFGSADSYVYCLDAATGKCAWYYPNHHCVKGSIAMFDGRIYHGGRDNKIHCYDLQGRMDWETRTGNDMDSSPVVYDGRGYIGGEDHYAYCFDPQTGKLLWKSEEGGSFESSACIADDAVVLGDSRGQLFSFDLKTGKTRWKANTQGDTDSTAAYFDGRIYTGSATGDSNETGHLWCLDAKTGKPIWHLPFSRGFWASPSLNTEKGMLYIGNADGYFYALHMADGSLVWKRNLHARVWGSAAVVDGCCVVGVRDGRLWCLNEADGKPLWCFDTPGDIDATPCVADGRVLTGDQQGGVYCIGEAPAGEAINPHWFVTKFPQSQRLDHATAGIPQHSNPAPPPGTYQDTNAGCRDHYREPVYGPAHNAG